MRRLIGAGAFGLFAVVADANEVINQGGYSVEVADSGGVRTIFTATSPVIEAPKAQPSELIQKAQSCVARTVTTSGRGEGPLVEIVDPNSILAVNVRVEYFARLLQFTVKSRLAIEARDGRYRMVHTDMWSGSGGSMQKLTKIWGTGWERSLTELIAVSDKIADCMETEAGPSKQDW